jgi:hypothetical protein
MNKHVVPRSHRVKRATGKRGRSGSAKIVSGRQIGALVSRFFSHRRVGATVAGQVCLGAIGHREHEPVGRVNPSRYDIRKDVFIVGFSKNVPIERRIPEFGRMDITHNVEFSLHAVRRESLLTIPRDGNAIRGKHFAGHPDFIDANLAGELLSSIQLLRNSAILVEREGLIIVANLVDMGDKTLDILIADLVQTPVAIFECKRVGVEDGIISMIVP